MGLAYSDYQNAVLKNFADQGLGTPGADSYLKEGDWNGMSSKDQYDNMLMVAPALKDPQGASAGDTMPTKWLGANADQLAAFTAKFGAPKGALNFTAVDPTIYGHGADKWANDPSRFLKMPDGSTVFEGTNADGSFGSNVNGSWLAQQQAIDSKNSNNFMLKGAGMIGLGALGGAAYGGMFGDLGTLAGASGEGDWVPSLGEEAGSSAGGSGGFTSPNLYGGEIGTQAAAPVTDLSTTAGATGNGLSLSNISSFLRAGGLLSSLLGGGKGTPSGSTSGGNNMPTSLADLLAQGGLGALSQRQGTGDINQYRGDINNLVQLGTGGITPADRSGAQGLIKGVYDGSISPDQVLDRVPGLHAMSLRGAADINSRFSGQGESAPNDPHTTKAWIDYNNELVNKAWDQEMNRTANIAGYNINPSTAANGGLNALGQAFRARQNLSSGTSGLLGRILGSLGNSGDTNSIFGALSKLLSGNDSSGGFDPNLLARLTSGTPSSDGAGIGDLQNDPLFFGSPGF